MKNLFNQQVRPEVNVGVLFLKRSRPGFMPEWGEYIEGKVREQLQSSNFNVFTPETKIVDIPSLHKALNECDHHGCDVLVALQPTMSDGRMAPVLAQRSSAPVIFWATPEQQEGDMISACSLVGAHTFAATLAQAGHPFEFVYGMPGEKQTVEDFSQAVYRAYAYLKLRNARVALVGYHAPGFIDMHADPATLRTSLGAEFFHVGLQEFMQGVSAVTDAEAGEDAAQLKNIGLQRADDIEDADVLLASKFYLHIKSMMQEMGLHALAIREWPEICGNLQWPYLALARLNSEGYAVACEGDLDGALGCLLGNVVGCGTCYLSDWLEHSTHHVTLWHGGAAPFQFCQGPESEKPPVITRHFNSGIPAVVDATLKFNMEITLFRLWHCNGRYLFTAIEGETVKPKRHLQATNGIGYFPDVDINEYFHDLIRAGFPHHPTVAQGHVKKQLSRVMDNLGVECL